MIFAKNDLEVVGFPKYKGGADNEYIVDRGDFVQKLSVRIRTGAEPGDEPFGAIFMQVTENDEQFFDDPYDTEFELDNGFHSITFITPVMGWRFRLSHAEQIAAVSFRAYW
jgi:hypothetical protein